ERTPSYLLHLMPPLSPVSYRVPSPISFEPWLSPCVAASRVCVCVLVRWCHRFSSARRGPLPRLFIGPRLSPIHRLCLVCRWSPVRFQLSMLSHSAAALH